LLASPADLSATINSALPEEVRAIALLSLGRMFADRGEYERARAALVQALTRPPDDPQAAASLYFLSGYVAQVGDPPDLDEAVEAYSRALKAQPDLAAAYNNRGLAYLRRGLAGDAALAVNDLTQAMAFLSPDASLLTNRGAAYLRLAGNPGEASGLRPQEATTLAVQDFDAAIALEPDMVEAIFDRGIAYVRLDEKENWLADFERVLELDADHAGAANGLCWAYALEQAPESALPYCERAVALDSTGAGLDSRAIVYGELGRYTEAAADMESYLQSLRAQDETNYARLSPLREEWLTALRTGRNPFGRATLERLRLE
jgi:tetratricopeptide (TPR) repeat protein